MGRSLCERNAQVTVPPGAQALLVEMERSRGDPVLFVKPTDSGTVKGSLPSRYR